MSEYIKISDVIKICKSLYSSYGTTAFFNAPSFEDLLRTVAVEFPEPPEVCEECRNCDWFWEDRDPNKECLGEEQPCEKYKPLRNWYKNIVQV